MDTYALESFIDFCDDMQITQESSTIKDKVITQKLLGKVFHINIKNSHSGEEPNIEVLKYLNSKEFWDYLYQTNLHKWSEVNGEPTFGNKPMNSGKDLMQAVADNNGQDILEIMKKDGITYIGGEYWVDPEHGFLITFPNGKLVKKKLARNEPALAHMDEATVIY